MTTKHKQSLPRKSKEGTLYFIDESSISSSDDEIGFQYFFQDQIEKDFVEDSPEAENKARTAWNELDLMKKRTFLRKSKDEEVDIKKISKNRKSQRSPSPILKKMKKEQIQNSENNLVVKHENGQLFEMEIQRLVASPAQYCYQPVCCICEIYTENKTVIQCTGVCKRFYHLSCLKESKVESPNFKCIDCAMGTYQCILCGTVDDVKSLLFCENADCGRLYHRLCLDKGNFVGLEILPDRIRSCPSHYCISCVREDPSHAQNHTKKLIECLRCPISFHCNDFCMAAGAYELSLSHVICPRHFEKDLITKSTYKPFHPAWCFKCFKTGVKLLCRFCPSSFHSECVENQKDLSETQIKNYVCSNCRNYKQPRYGEISFVKVSQYRWWPCEIIHPRNAPMNILKLNRPDGTYPVLFLGSNEYQWVAKTRSIDFNTAKQSSIFKDTGGTNKMDREFTTGLKVAMKIHRVFVNILLMYVPLKSISASSMSDDELEPFIKVQEMDQKTVKFKFIKSNVLVSPAKLPLKLAPSICDCTDSCLLSICKNYQKKIECQIFYCPTKTKCQNQQFTNNVNKNLAVFKTPNRGFGFKTMVSINKNDFIIEYLGDMISKSESIIRIQHSKRCNMKEFYMVKLTQDLIIDAGPKGNLSRYINHSCDPNCYLDKWIVNGYPRLGVFASKDIEPDQEITFDYRISGVIMKEDTFCLCGSLNCTGFLGPIKSYPNSPIKSLVSSKNSSTPLTVEIAEKLSIIAPKDEFVKPDEVPKAPIVNEMPKEDIDGVHEPESAQSGNTVTERTDSEDSSKTIHENFCYRCFDGGDLVVCDKTSCPKTYHHLCLGLEHAPSGIWYCPWHFCDICGKPSKVFCVQCPGSYCDLHVSDEYITKPKDGSKLSHCRRHSNDKLFRPTNPTNHISNSDQSVIVID